MERKWRPGAAGGQRPTRGTYGRTPARIFCRALDLWQGIHSFGKLARVPTRVALTKELQYHGKLPLSLHGQG